MECFHFSSALYWPHCGGEEGTVMGRKGAREGQPPSGIAIILQTECHALQTPDKETVTHQVARGDLRKKVGMA